MSNKIDIAISYFGKPFQTIATIHSILAHSQQHIDHIYVSIERQQPYQDAWKEVFRIKQLFQHKGLKLYFSTAFMPHEIDKDPANYSPEQALNFRYEYAFRKSNKKLLLVLHNDMLFERDVVGDMIKRFENRMDTLMGVGLLGQCWNCPAFFDNKCSSTIFPAYRPSTEEAIHLYESHQTPRKALAMKRLAKGKAFPMPECRLNEHLCLINVDLYREACYPNGTAPYFGGIWDGTDTCTEWFYDVVNKGYQFENFDWSKGAIHAPFSSSKSGMGADSRRDIYDDIEAQSKAYIIENYELGSLSLAIQLEKMVFVMKKKLGQLRMKLR